MDSIDLVVEALKKVPEKKLKIIGIANSIPIVDGHFDFKSIEERHDEIELAKLEATAYGGHTLNAVATLARLRAARKE